MSKILDISTIATYVLGALTAYNTPLSSLAFIIAIASGVFSLAIKAKQFKNKIKK